MKIRSVRTKGLPVETMAGENMLDIVFFNMKHGMDWCSDAA